MHYVKLVVTLMFLSKCVALYIKQLKVPSEVKYGSEDPVILDVEYDLEHENNNRSGLVVKWLMGDHNHLVYQWIPPFKPQGSGAWKDFIDTNYVASSDPLQMYRALKFKRAIISMTSNYTCLVSTYDAEERQTKPMIIYSIAGDFKFEQGMKQLFIGLLTCKGKHLYPEPNVTISSEGRIVESHTTLLMEDDGRYTFLTQMEVHENDLKERQIVYTCQVELPGTSYKRNITTTYEVGRMPPQTGDPDTHDLDTTMDKAAFDGKAKSRHQKAVINGCPPALSLLPVLFAQQLLLLLGIV